MPASRITLSFVLVSAPCLVWACSGSSGTDLGGHAADAPDQTSADASSPPVGTGGEDGGAPTDGGPPLIVDGGTAGGDGLTCQTAVRIVAPAVLLKNQSTMGTDRRYVGCNGMRGRDRVYAVNVPAGQRLRARAISVQGSFEPEIHVVRGPAKECDGNPLACTGNSDRGHWVIVPNAEAAAQEMFLIVDADDLSDPGGKFDIEVYVEPPPAGDTCATAETVAIAAGSTVNKPGLSTELYSQDVTTGIDCSSPTGPERFFQVAVPPGQKLTATVTPEVGFSPAVNLFVSNGATCASPLTCWSGVTGYSGGGSVSATQVNRKGAAETVFVAAASRDPNSAPDYLGGPFGLTLELSAASTLPGESCETAVPLAAGDTLPSESTVGYDVDYPKKLSGDCKGRGPDRVYAITVPAGQQLAVTATPEAAFNIALDIITGGPGACNARPRTCVATADSQGAGKAETASWQNLTGADQAVFVTVRGGTYGGESGSYALTATLTP